VTQCGGVEEVRVVDEQDDEITAKRTGPQMILEELELYIRCVLTAR
jgi:hypothetical protein